MNAGSLFSGIGGLDLGVGVPPAWFCEQDPHCRTVLERHWPGVPVYPDVRELGADTPPVDVLHGGYPCQPFSSAGKRGGENDPRHLWPEFARLVRILRPRVVIAENVAGHLGLGFHAVLADLASLGFDVRWGIVRASDLGAPHKRARLFIVATHSANLGLDRTGEARRRRTGPADGDRSASDADELYVRAGRRRWGATGGARPRADSQTPSDADAGGGRGRLQPLVGARDDACGRGENHRDRHSDTDWGIYTDAIRRWANVVGQAPRPTDARGRLMPEFVEWMMGFPVGWTDGPARTHRLRMLGNAVVPQQARFALGLLSGAQ